MKLSKLDTERQMPYSHVEVKKELTELRTVITVGKEVGKVRMNTCRGRLDNGDQNTVGIKF